jgi:hypothetical protein
LARIASNSLAFLLDEPDKPLERGWLRVFAPSQYQIGLVVIVLEAKETDSYGALIHGACRDQCDALTCGYQREQCVHEIGFARYLRGEAALLAHAKNRVIDGGSAIPLKKDERFFGQLFDLEFPSRKAMSRGNRNNQRFPEDRLHFKIRSQLLRER